MRSRQAIPKRFMIAMSYAWSRLTLGSDYGAMDVKASKLREIDRQSLFSNDQMTVRWTFFEKFKKWRQPMQSKLLQVDEELLSDIEEIDKSHIQCSVYAGSDYLDIECGRFSNNQITGSQHFFSKLKIPRQTEQFKQLHVNDPAPHRFITFMANARSTLGFSRALK